jgi:hypothetical protein
MPSTVSVGDSVEAPVRREVYRSKPVLIGAGNDGVPMMMVLAALSTLGGVLLVAVGSLTVYHWYLAS